MLLLLSFASPIPFVRFLSAVHCTGVWGDADDAAADIGTWGGGGSPERPRSPVAVLGGVDMLRGVPKEAVLVRAAEEKNENRANEKTGVVSVVSGATHCRERMRPRRVIVLRPASEHVAAQLYVNASVCARNNRKEFHFHLYIPDITKRRTLAIYKVLSNRLGGSKNVRNCCEL